METKEINVSDIQAQVVKSNQSKEAEIKALVAEVQQSSEADQSQATLIAQSVAAAMSGLMDAQKKEREDRLKLAQVQIQTVIPADQLPNADVYTSRSGKPVVYIPYDITRDIHDWDCEWEIFNNRHFQNPSELDFLNDKPRFDAIKINRSLPALHFYQKREGLQAYLTELDTESDSYERNRSNVQNVLDQVNAAYSELIGNLETLTPQSSFSFEDMSVILSQPGIKIVIPNGGVELAAITTSAQIVHSMFGDYIYAKADFYVYNTDLQKSGTEYFVGGFKGKKTFEECGIFPIGQNQELKDRLKLRGQKYLEVTAKPSYFSYKGDIVRKNWRSSTAFRSTGRVMVDFTSMQIMDPNYSQYLGGTGNNDGYGYRSKNNVVISDDVLITLSPFVYGFSFLSKVWGELQVEKLTPIVFRDDAYDRLVMEEDQKAMILSLVETKLAGKADLIDGKGGGCIFLLAGEPGTGKTLTAEVTAERLKRPLYMVGVGELGTSADELEQNLRQILDIASEWDAVLLLDECDIFMEARTDSNIERNAMVGVFLRLLEYYQGVLFLTSNRAKNIDKAFYSRISMAINFPSLTSDDRYSIWENNLDLNKIELEEEEISDLAEYDVNGRQIKNVVRLASALAFKAERPVAYDDFTMVLDRGIEFQEAVFARGDTDTDMTFGAIGKHDTSLDNEYLDVNYVENEPGFFSRLFRAVGSFFTTLGS
jgi:hypothetical protein